ncbi:MAG: DUF4926 domain-containing protein [Microcystis sp.]
MNNIQDYDLVALTEDITAIHKTTHQTILLRCGQIGTVVMSFDQKAFLIDFSDCEGKTFAMETVDHSKLLRLIIEDGIIKLFSFDPNQEVIVRWIP